MCIRDRLHLLQAHVCKYNYAQRLQTALIAQMVAIYYLYRFPLSMDESTSFHFQISDTGYINFKTLAREEIAS